MSTVDQAADPDLLAADIAWDIETLVDGGGEAGVAALLDGAEARAEALTAYRGRIAELDAAELAELMRGVERVTADVQRAGSYASLRFAVDTGDGALLQQVQERATEITNRLVFVDLEWVEVDDGRADTLVADPTLAFCAHHLRSARRYRPHVLSEAEEQLDNERAVTGRSAWVRLFSQLTSEIEVRVGDESTLTLDAALGELGSPEADRRRTVAEAITEGLAPGLSTRAYVYNTLLQDRAVSDRLRGHPTWVSAWNLAQETSDESVEALVEAVRTRYDIPQRWYALKGRMLGIDLADHDRMASVSSAERRIGWTEATEVVRDAYASFSTELADITDRFVAERWIDAPARPTKQPGAFCSYTVPEHHPYVMLNWAGRSRDVLTLAHELGHGVHGYLAREQGIFHQSTPLTVAETASVFGETVTFGRLLDVVDDPNERLTLLADRMDDTVATVFRQVAMNRFEHAAHTARRTEGELSVDRFGELWFETQHEMLGDAVRITDGYRSWWSYVPHFIGAPGYVYAYAYGLLLALAVYRRYEIEGDAFVPAYLDLLRAGGSASPEELGRIVGCDVTDPEFWSGGLELVDDLLGRCQAAAMEAGRLG